MVEFDGQAARILQDQKKKSEEQSKKGWFSGWFGGGGTDAQTGGGGGGGGGEVVKSLQAKMTAEEKAKLYAAIGYEENAVPATYPKDYVENRFEFLLKKLMILPPDGARQPVILLASLASVALTVEQRPVAQAVRVAVHVGDFSIDGSPRTGETPRLIQPMDQQCEILDLLYETNPSDETCHQRIRLAAQPLVAVYDAQTLERVTAMFRTEQVSSEWKSS